MKCIRFYRCTRQAHVIKAQAWPIPLWQCHLSANLRMQRQPPAEHLFASLTLMRPCRDGQATEQGRAQMTASAMMHAVSCEEIASVSCSHMAPCRSHLWAAAATFNCQAKAYSAPLASLPSPPSHRPAMSNVRKLVFCESRRLQYKRMQFSMRTENILNHRRSLLDHTTGSMRKHSSPEAIWQSWKKPTYSLQTCNLRTGLTHLCLGRQLASRHDPSHSTTIGTNDQKRSRQVQEQRKKKAVAPLHDAVFTFTEDSRRSPPSAPLDVEPLTYCSHFYAIRSIRYSDISPMS